MNSQEGNLISDFKPAEFIAYVAKIKFELEATKIEINKAKDTEEGLRKNADYWENSAAFWQRQTDFWTERCGELKKDIAHLEEKQNELHNLMRE